MIYKKIIASLIVSCFFTNLISLEIPLSTQEDRSEINFINQFLRVVPSDSLLIPLNTDVWIYHNTSELVLDIEAEIDKTFSYGKLCNEDDWPESDFFRIQIITDLKNYYSYITFFKKKYCQEKY